MVKSRLPLVRSLQVPHADGTTHDYHVVRYPVLSGDGSVTAFGAFSLDVTDQRRSDRARDVALAELAEAQALAQIGSWQWNTTLDEATWSAEMYPSSGETPRRGRPRARRSSRTSIPRTESGSRRGTRKPSGAAYLSSLTTVSFMATGQSASSMLSVGRTPTTPGEPPRESWRLWGVLPLVEPDSWTHAAVVG